VVVAMTAVIGLSVAGALQVALPVLARRDASIGVTGYGFLNTALGVGLVAGGLAGGRLARLRSQGRLVVTLLAVNAVLLAVLPSLPGLPVMLAAMAALGASDGALGVVVITVLQRMPPPSLRGRVLAVLASVNFATYPLSVVGAGAVLSALSPAAVFEVTGVGVGLVAVIGAASPTVRRA
jgi:DHA3 family tetracycline resistance protein-like MFS transporter